MPTMQHGDTVGWVGSYRVTTWRHPTAAADCPACRTSLLVPAACPAHPPLLVAQTERRNLITNLARNEIRKILDSDETPDMGIEYLAWGDDDTAPAAGDTTLGNELGRKAITSQTLTGTTGEIVTSVYLAPTDANEAIEELAWYGGTSATATTDSGLLIARALYDHTKTSAESIQIDRTDTIGG